MPIDSNDTERDLRALTIGRRNWLFLGSPAAGPGADALYTLVASSARDPLDVWANLAYVPLVTHAGVKMYESGRGFMHHKVLLVDDSVSVIGTAIFDNRFFQLNFEMTVVTIDERFAAEVPHSRCVCQPASRRRLTMTIFRPILDLIARGGTSLPTRRSRPRWRRFDNRR